MNIGDWLIRITWWLLLALVSFGLGSILAEKRVSKAKRAEEKEELTAFYCENRSWVCVERQEEPYGGPFGSRTESILIEDAGSKQRIRLSNFSNSIKTGDQVYLRLLAPNEKRCGPIYLPKGDMLAAGPVTTTNPADYLE